MRFDDMIETSLGWEDRDAASRDRAWLQLIDLLAGGRGEEEPAAGARALARLRAMRPAIAPELRRRSAETLAGRRVPPALLGFFAEDADVARPLLANVALDGDEWAHLLADAPERARAILAARADFPRDGAEPAATLRIAADEDVLEAPDQIRDLLARIEAFQTVPVETAGFGFAIDEDGRFVLDDGAMLGLAIGDETHGVDGQVIGAWRAGEPFADARLVVPEGLHGGEWRISATPLPGSEPLRYRGTARPPRADETASPVIVSAMPAIAPSRDLQLDEAIDGLRAPLGAVTNVGVAPVLRDGALGVAATEVVERSLELLDAIDSFDMAAAAVDESEPFDAATVLGRLHGALLPLAEARGVTLTFRIARDLPPLAVDPQAVERMFSRLIGAALGLARPGERMVARLGLDRADGGRLALIVTRPGRLTGRSAEMLRDPPQAGSADAALLAFGFALRLVERLADEAGGGFTIHDDRLHLALPRRAAAGERARR